MKIYNGYSRSEEAARLIQRARTRVPVMFGASDECAICHGVNVGADGVKCYFYTKPESVTVQVRTNKVIYLF